MRVQQRREPRTCPFIKIILGKMIRKTDTCDENWVRFSKLTQILKKKNPLRFL